MISTVRLAIICLILPLFAPISFAQKTLTLSADWEIQNSTEAGFDGKQIASRSYNSRGWTKTTVPSTVLGALVESGKFGDPFFGKNFRKIPGTDYTEGSNYGTSTTLDASPFSHGWWYRKTFHKPELKPGQNIDLHFQGIDYSAEVWINGERIADPSTMEGTYRTYTLDITPWLRDENVIAVLVHGSNPKDLAPSWVDWNPTPADKNMGLWQKVFLRTQGAVAIRDPQVITKLGATLSRADVTVEATLLNKSGVPQIGVLKGSLASQKFSKQFLLEPNETRLVELKLKVDHPALWWPKQMGKPNLHDLKLQFELSSGISDTAEKHVGLREVTSELTPEGSRLFKINGFPIQIRGGGWSSDIFLRFSRDRIEKELRYVRDLNLNTVRLEGKMQPDWFYDLTDELGILVMPGWVCCSMWETPANWTDRTRLIAQASLADQIKQLRAHPSVFVFLYGSDKAPIKETEEMYLQTFSSEHWPNPTLAAAGEEDSITGRIGVKMTGPYDYVPPSYWYKDPGEYGGAWGFNTETSPGGAVPPIESLKKFIPADHLWPVDEVWNHHAGENEFKDIHLFKNALDARYGASAGVDEFAMKSQVMAYDNERAMFEAYGKNKYKSATGIVQWMLNNAWPSLIWHLYDYYLLPGGSYFGAKKALEKQHIQYSHDDRAIVVVNSAYSSAQDLTATAAVYDFNLNLLSIQSARNLKLAADSTNPILQIPEIKSPTKTYFVKLELKARDGKVVSDNFYWLSTQTEVYRWKDSTFFYTPLDQDGDLTQLNTLPKAEVKAASKISVENRNGLVTVKNTGRTLAFSIRLKLVRQQDGEELLPVLWEDNYFSLLPGESKTVSVSFDRAADVRAPLVVRLSGWNVTDGQAISVTKRKHQRKR